MCYRALLPRTSSSVPSRAGTLPSEQMLLLGPQHYHLESAEEPRLLATLAP